VRERVGLVQPARGRKHRHVSGADRRRHLARPRDEHRADQARRDEVRVLVHGQNRHPVGRIIREPKPAIHFADRISERPAARNNEQATVPGSSADRRERGIEVFAVRQHAATKLHDHLGSRSAVAYCLLHVGRRTRAVKA
jgi:hypothetical protein